MRSFLMTVLGLAAIVACASADEKCQTCEPAKGRCEWVTETKKSKKVEYSEKRSEFCPSTVAANCPAWAALCRAVCGDDHAAPRTKRQLVKKFVEKEEPVRKLKLVP